MERIEFPEEERSFGYIHDENLENTPEEIEELDEIYRSIDRASLPAKWDSRTLGRYSCINKSFQGEVGAIIRLQVQFSPKKFSPKKFGLRHFSPDSSVRVISVRPIQSQINSVPKNSVPNYSVQDSSVLSKFSPQIIQSQKIQSQNIQSKYDQLLGSAIIMISYKYDQQIQSAIKICNYNQQLPHTFSLTRTYVRNAFKGFSKVAYSLISLG